MHFFIMLIIMAVLLAIWPNATRAIIIAPIMGIVLGGLAWSIVAINDRSFNSLESYLTFTVVAILLAEAWEFRNGLIDD